MLVIVSRQVFRYYSLSSTIFIRLHVFALFMYDIIDYAWQRLLLKERQYHLIKRKITIFFPLFSFVINVKHIFTTTTRGLLAKNWRTHVGAEANERRNNRQSALVDFRRKSVLIDGKNAINE